MRNFSKGGAAQAQATSMRASGYSLDPCSAMIPVRPLDSTPSTGLTVESPLIRLNPMWAVVQSVRGMLGAMGFDLDALKDVPQIGCPH
jgi:hypothetical protein